MDRTERFYIIRNLLSQKGVATFAQLMRLTEVSRATLNRDLSYLRDRMNVPIIHDREAGGYRLQPEAQGEGRRLKGSGSYIFRETSAPKPHHS